MQRFANPQNNTEQSDQLHDHSVADIEHTQASPPVEQTAPHVILLLDELSDEQATEIATQPHSESQLLVITSNRKRLQQLLQRPGWQHPLKAQRLRFAVVEQSGEVSQSIALLCLKQRLFEFCPQNSEQLQIWPETDQRHQLSEQVKTMLTLQHNFTTNCHANTQQSKTPLLQQLQLSSTTAVTQVHNTETIKSHQCDVAVISPHCLIFNSLAAAFKANGHSVQLFTCPEDMNQPQLRQQLIEKLNRANPKLIISRNRSCFEANNPLQTPKSEHLLHSKLVSWWWDIPNVASLIEMSGTAKAQHLAFAKAQLPLLPYGATWLPAGAQPIFCAPEFLTQQARPESHNGLVTFVGQSRYELLQENLTQLVSMLSELVDPAFNSILTMLNTFKSVIAIHPQLLKLRQQLKPTFAQLKQTLPYHSYYMEYILEMATTAAFRIAAVQTVAKAGLPLKVYGDEGWVSNGLIDAAFYGGELRHHDLVEVYRSSQVNLNLNFMQVSSTINPKVLDIAACGGVVLTDHRPEMDVLYPDSFVRPTAFKQLEELPDKVATLMSMDMSKHCAELAAFTQANHRLQQRAEWIVEHYLGE